MGSQRTAEVILEPTQLHFGKGESRYKVGTRTGKVKPAVPRTLVHQGELLPATQTPDAELRHLKALKKAAKKKRLKAKRKRLRQFLLILSGVVIPPWGAILLASWLIYRTRPKNKARRLMSKAFDLAVNNPTAALPLLEKAHQINPADNDILAAAGYVAHNAEDYDIAWRFLQELGRHNNLTHDERLLLGHSYYRTGAFEEAIETLQSIPETFDDYTKVALILAGCFAEKNDPEAALEVLEKGPAHVLSKDDNLKELHYQLGVMYEQMGDEEKAYYHFRRVYIADVNYRDVRQRINWKAHKPLLPEAPSIPQQIRELAALRDEGILSEEAFETKKADLLSRL